MLLSSLSSWETWKGTCCTEDAMGKTLLPPPIAEETKGILPLALALAAAAAPVAVLSMVRRADVRFREMRNNERSGRRIKEVLYRECGDAS